MASDEENNLFRAGGLLSASLSSSDPKPAYNLSDLFAPPIVKELYYNGKTVNLDGYRFIGCRFDNCILEAHSTNFRLINCVIDQSTLIRYGSETLRIVQLFNSRHSDWAAATFGQSFVPEKNPDGTITL